MTQLALIKQSTKARNANRVPILQMEKSNSSDKMVLNSLSFSFQIDFRYFAMITKCIVSIGELIENEIN